MLIANVFFHPDTKVDAALLVPVQCQPRNGSHLDVDIPILLAGVLHGRRKSSRCTLLLVAPLCLRTNSTSEEHYEAFDGIQCHAGHCCAKQRGTV